jgi:hypothetical protein
MFSSTHESGKKQIIYCAQKSDQVAFEFQRQNSYTNIDALNLGFHMMPQLLAWIGREEKELSIMLDFLRGVPTLFEHLPSKKPKRP